MGLDIGATMECARVDRNGISAIKIDVIVSGQKDMPREEFWESRQDHDAEIKHSHGSWEERSCSGTKAPSEGQEIIGFDAGLKASSTMHGRHLSEILKIIAAAPISESAKRAASDIFRGLGEAEAKVHNVDVEKVHFHEVGAADAITDIVCAAVGAEALGVERFMCSPLNVGGGTVKCAHGVMPVPAPATLELLKGIPVYSGEVQKELVTPTGAAIIRVLATSFGGRPAMTTEKIGYGAGARDFPGHPNVLRITVGDLPGRLSDVDTTENVDEEELAVLEANLDDLSPQIIGYLVDQLLAEGALDVFTTAVQMKKSRPGTLLTVLAKPETSRNCARRCSARAGHWGSAAVASSAMRSRVVTSRCRRLGARCESRLEAVGSTDSHYAPEYEDCRRIAMEHHVPLKSVMLESLRLYLDKKNG